MTFTMMAIVEARTKCAYVDLMGSALVSQGSVNEEKHPDTTMAIVNDRADSSYG